MKRQPDSVEISVLALFEKEPLDRHGAHGIDDILKQMPANAISYDDLTTMLSDMIHAGWLVGRILPGPGGVAADIVDMDVTEEGERVSCRNRPIGLDNQASSSGSATQTDSPAGSSAPKCFISYSSDSEGHKTWVRKLAEALSSNGVFVALDQWEDSPGNDLPGFMEQVGQSDFVVVVCSPRLLSQAAADGSGARYEKRIIGDRLMHQSPSDGRVIPVLRLGGEAAVPTFLRGLIWIDFSEDATFSSRLEDLLRRIFAQPVYVRPPLGPRPMFSPAEPQYIRVQESVVQQAMSGVRPTSTHTESRTEQPDPLPELEHFYGQRPFYAVWAWPTALPSTLMDTQGPSIQGILRNPPGRGNTGYTLTYAASNATIVQEGLHFSSPDQRLDLSDSGSMVFSSSLSEFVRDERYNQTMHPLPLIEYTVSFVALFSALWSANCVVRALEPSNTHLSVRMCLSNARGWELRPGKPGTEGYGHLHDLFDQHRPISLIRLQVPLADPYVYLVSDYPDQVSLTLLKSVYSAFGYKLSDIPYYDPERLVFKF